VGKIHKGDLKSKWLSSPNISFREEVRVERGEGQKKQMLTLTDLDVQIDK